MREPRLRIAVDCYAGYRGEETPRRLRIGACRVEVSEVLDRWLAPEHRYFKLRGNDGVYIVCHHPAADTWELTFFDSGRNSEEYRLSST